MPAPRVQKGLPLSASRTRDRSHAGNIGLVTGLRRCTPFINLLTIACFPTVSPLKPMWQDEMAARYTLIVEKTLTSSIS